jgi:hypothetical protein
MTELNRPGLPAVLAADPHLELRARAAAVVHGHPNQFPHACSIEDAERVVG